MDKKKAAFYTLGCKLNFSETSSISRIFKEKGFEKCKKNEVNADVVLINTCSVTDIADKKCRQVIKKAKQKHPNAKIIVTGCYAQLKPNEISEIKDVDLVLTQEDKANISQFIDALDSYKETYVSSCDVESLKTFFPTFSIGDRTRSFLKVQDGCDYSCTYCTIPLARGKSRNGTISEIVDTAKKIANDGAKEIILTGVNIGDFGKSTGETFLSLITELDQVEGIDRIRISSIEPNLLTNEIIEFVAKSKRFAPHFHIPLQSGSNKVLAIMKRRYNTELFTQRINKIYSLMPDAFVGIDVIVGVSGESDEDFENTYKYLEEIEASQLHVFTFSERENTLAYSFDNKVPKNIRKERSKILHTLSEKKLHNFLNSMKGKEMNVLFEDYNKKGKMYGYTKNYVRIESDFNTNLVNKITKIKLNNLQGDVFVV